MCEVQVDTKTSWQNVIKNFLEHAQIPQVTEEENNNITAPITEEEVLDFIKSLNPNKAPGISELRSGHFL